MRFNDGDIVISDALLEIIIENYCCQEDGVRNMKRCLEIIHTKLNLYKLMKPGVNLFEKDICLKVEFPLILSVDIIKKLIKTAHVNQSYLSMYT